MARSEWRMRHALFAIRLIHREAIIHPDAVSLPEIVLAAARGAMRRIPRAVAAAIAVGHTHLDARPGVVAQIRGIAFGLARPIVAGVVTIVGEGAAIGHRARQR